MCLQEEDPLHLDAVHPQGAVAMVADHPLAEGRLLVLGDLPLVEGRLHVVLPSVRGVARSDAARAPPAAPAHLPLANAPLPLKSAE